MTAVEAFTRQIVEAEQQHRTMLRLSLEPDTAPRELPLRKGRAIGWFEGALSPLVPELGEAGVHRLAVAVRSVVGIEALAWLTGIAGLSRDQASEVMQRSAQALLHHAIAAGLYGAR